jgi:hypothetical protein
MRPDYQVPRMHESESSDSNRPGAGKRGRAFVKKHGLRNHIVIVYGRE